MKRIKKLWVENILFKGLASIFVAAILIRACDMMIQNWVYVGYTGGVA